MSYIGRKGQTAPLASADLPTNSISTAHLINDSVTSAKIGVDVIVAEDIAANAITVAEIADDAVTADKLANSINTDIATGVAALPKTGGTMTGTIADFRSTGIDDNADALAITIDASENVGIGTAAPDYPLHIYKSGAHTSFHIENDNANFLLQAGTVGGLAFYDVDNTAYRMTITNAGKVGIGCTDPANNLEVRSTVQAQIKVQGVDQYACGVKIRNNYSSVQSDWNLMAAGGTSGWAGTNGSFVIRDDTTNSTGLEIEQGAGSNDAAMLIDSSGRVTMGSQPGFFCTKNGTIYETAAATVVTGWTINSNVGGHFVSSTGIFTAPVAGRYLFLYNVMSGQTTGDVQYRIYKNGSTVAGSNSISQGGSWRQTCVTAIIELAYGDEVSFIAYSSNTTSIVILYSGTYSHISGMLLA